MARTEARLRCDVWENADFRSLPMQAQWLYTAILTQKDLSLCGVITWTPKRFAKLSPNMDARTVRKALDILRQSRFVWLDENTDELWVRTLIKHDRVLVSPNTFIALSRAYDAVHSNPIREGVIEAVVEGLGEGLGKGLGKGLTQGVLEGVGEGLMEGLPEPLRKRLGQGFAKDLALACTRVPAHAHASPVSGLRSPVSPSADEPQSDDAEPKANYGTPDEKAAADAVLREWWESRTPRPPNNFKGVQQVVRRLVASGVAPRDVRQALDDAPTPTLAALQVAIGRQSPTNTHNGRILTDRDGPSVAYIPESWK